LDNFKDQRTGIAMIVQIVRELVPFKIQKMKEITGVITVSIVSALAIGVLSAVS
jgi:hypothetical protein